MAAIWLSVLEMRATIAADLVRLCALCERPPFLRPGPSRPSDRGA